MLSMLLMIWEMQGWAGEGRCPWGPGERVRPELKVGLPVPDFLTPGHLLHNHHEPLLDATSLWSCQTSPPRTPPRGLTAATAFPPVLK